MPLPETRFAPVTLTRSPYLARVAVVASALAALATAGCGDGGREITVQQVPKGSEVIAVPTPVAPAADADLRIWSVPEGWREVESTAPMRLATLVIESAPEPVEVAVTSFPGDVGGRFANVNRWRGQVGLEPVSEEDLDELLRTFSHAGFEGYALRIDGREATMLAVGIHGAGADRTWFVRVVTDAGTASRVEPEVMAFARTFGTGTGRGGEEPR